MLRVPSCDRFAPRRLLRLDRVGAAEYAGLRAISIPCNGSLGHESYGVWSGIPSPGVPHTRILERRLHFSLRRKQECPGGNMKTSQKLGLVAIALFVISHFLPAYGDGSGFACFGVSWDTLLGHGAKFPAGSWFYYSGFAISNILFPVLVVALFVTERAPKLRAIVSLVFFLHVLSWPVLNLFEQLSEFGKIRIGYYVWLIAYGLLVAAHRWKAPGESLESIPPAHPV